MPRRLRIEFAGAIYHVMARGNGRQKIVRDGVDRRRLIAGLEHTVTRCGWELLSYVIMNNHLHLLLKTPRPNLASGMQVFLSGYALWAGRRRRDLGHLFQGRYRSEMIEDESHYWAVSRYIHLNPVRARLVARPDEWEWSSYPGYRSRVLRRSQSWVAHDALLAAWRGDPRGKDAASAYVRFVEAALKERLASPFRGAIGGWILGTERFREELRRRCGPIASNHPAPEARHLAAGLDSERIFTAVAEFYGLEASSLSRRHDATQERSVAAWLCRRHTEVTLRVLAERLGLSRADCVPNLTRRIEAQLKTSRRLATDLEQIMEQVRARPGRPPLATTLPGRSHRSDSKLGLK